MKNIILILFCFIFNTNSSLLSAQMTIFSQGEDYPLYSNVDTSFTDTISLSSRDTNYHYTFNIANLRAYKKHLEPLVKQNDAYALFLYGTCHCDIVNVTESPEGIRPVYFDTKNLPDTIGISRDTSMALNKMKCAKYLKKADSLNMAWASWDLYYMYRYSKLPAADVDYNLALQYLYNAEKTGDRYVKNLVYSSLSLAYLPDSTETGINPSFQNIEYNIDVGLDYALKAMEYSGYSESGNSRYLASLFERYGKYQIALEYQLKIEDSPYVTMRAASALILGGFAEDELVERNKERGVEIIRELLEEIEIQGNDELLDELIEWFNELHTDYCLFNTSEEENCFERPISINDLGKYFIH